MKIGWPQVLIFLWLMLSALIELLAIGNDREQGLAKRRLTDLVNNQPRTPEEDAEWARRRTWSYVAHVFVVRIGAMFTLHCGGFW